MKSIRVICSLALFISNAHAYTPLKGDTFVDICSSDDPFKASVCLGYVTGIKDLTAYKATLHEGKCSDQDVGDESFETLRKNAVKLLIEDPKGFPAIAITANVLAAFCK